MPDTDRRTDDWSGRTILRRGDTPIRRLQIYGQRCSGTNIVARSIQANLGGDVLTDAYGFKHWFVPPQILFPRDVLVVVVARDPFDWIRSLHRQPWHAHPDIKAMAFGDFIRAEWHSYWDSEFDGIGRDHPLLDHEMLHERCPDTGRRFANPIAKRTAKLRHWTRLADRAPNVALLSYDRFRARPEATIAALADAAGLPRVAPFHDLESYKGKGLRPYVPTPYPPIAAADLAHIHAWLDPQVERSFGFDIAAAGNADPDEVHPQP